MHFGFNEMMWFAVLIVNFIIVLAVYRFMGKTGLFVWMAIASILANIQVLKLVDFFGWNITLGNVLYGTSFLATDIISENYSKELAHKSVWVGFFAVYPWQALWHILYPRTTMSGHIISGWRSSPTPSSSS